MTNTHNLHVAPDSDARATSATHHQNVSVRGGPDLHAANDGLGAFHRNPEDMDIGNRRNRIIGAIVIALILGAGGAYIYSMIPPEEVPVVADDDLPRPGSLTEMMPNAAPAASDNPQLGDPGATVTETPPAGAAADAVAPTPTEPTPAAP